MYYCIACKQLHRAIASQDHVVFTTGYHFLNAVRYSAGMCAASSEKLTAVTEKVEPVSA